MIRIEVTETDIKRGVRGNGDECAIARAIKRFIRENKLRGWCVSVDSDNVNFDHDAHNGINVALPKTAQNFIVKFDDVDNAPKSSLKPFGFSIKGISVRENSLVAT